MIDLQGIITDQANLYPGHFHFFYKINIICVNDMATEASLQLNLGTGGRLEVQVPKNRGKHCDKQKFLLSGNKQTSDILFCQCLSMYLTTMAGQ